LLTQAQLK